MYENSTISLADARSRFDPLNVLGFRYSFVWVIRILNQLRKQLICTSQASLPAS
jgi:hypothetical protein